MPHQIWDSFSSMLRRTDYQEADSSGAYLEEHVWPEVWDPTGVKLIAAMDEAGVGASVIMPMDFGVALGEAGLGIEEKNRRCAAVADRYPGRVYSFVGVDPRRPGAKALVRQAVTEWGARGIKLYPPTGFYADAPEYYGLYELALELGVPVAFHTGTARFPLKGLYGHPMYVDAVAADLPDLNIVLLHVASNYCWAPHAIAFASLKPNLYLEVSGWQDLAHLRPARFYRVLKEMVTRVGSERILFGSDHSGLRRSVSYADWVGFFMRLPDAAPEYGFDVTSDDRERILSGNARRLLRLDGEVAA
jgi:predicted TIM-barrel fold metal-dependent hydrolase